MSSSSRLIGKNTLILYFRMLFSMAVSLYTSRVVLETLGVEDYGIYNVVGGVVAMFGFLNASMSTATSRFLTVAIGKGNLGELKKLFSASFTVHIVLMLVVVLLAEIIGIWFIENKLVIPIERMNAARFVFQFSILSTAITITQVPYNALMLSHERIGTYAYFEILNTVLKLVIVLVLPYLLFDKLIIYSILIVFVSGLIRFISRYYCIRHFEEAHAKFLFEKEYVRPLLSFSGWDLYGNMSVMARTQGVNMLLNMFFGPVLNAASGVATSVQSAVGSFATNVVTAVRPQIQKRFAAGDVVSSISLMNKYTKYSFILLSLLTVPLVLEMPYILGIWLTEVPGYAVILCRLTLMFNLFSNTSVALMTVIHATGRIKFSSILNGSLYLSVVPITYILFKVNYPPYLPYILNVAFVYLGFTLNSIYLKKYVTEFSIVNFHKNVILCLLMMLVAFGVGGIAVYFMEASIIRLLAVVGLSFFYLLFATYFFLLSNSEKDMLIQIMKKWKLKQT